MGISGTTNQFKFIKIGLTKVIGDNAPGAIKESEIKNYFGTIEHAHEKVAKWPWTHPCPFTNS